MDEYVRARGGRRLLDDDLQKVVAEQDFRPPPPQHLRWDPESSAVKGGTLPHPSARTVEDRCLGTTGTWCSNFYTQQSLPINFPPPRGNVSCYRNCNNVGVCDYDTGICLCPAGWTGFDCSQPVNRPCTFRTRDRRDPYGIPISHVHPDTKEDLDWRTPGWMASRCAGYCDDSVGMCYCGRGSKHRRIPSGIGQPPVQFGRPMINPCQIGEDEHGNKLDWGRTPYEELYGPEGWCEAPETTKPIQNCGCVHDGLLGHLCTDWSESNCPNQCNGHGNCDQGFCKCHEGWYGTDCARKRAGVPMEPSDMESTRPWLNEVTKLPQAMINPEENKITRPDGQMSLPTRKRPFIYVYDLPAEYNTRMTQFRLASRACVWRSFHGNNASYFQTENTYMVEMYLHEALLSSSHRTLDPEEADFFYVPAYFTCYMWPVLGWADFPWWYAPSHVPRAMHISNMIMEIKHWMQRTYPWWDRRGGKDHIWLMAHDEGACSMPSEVYQNSIVLSHWGRLGVDHVSGTGWPPDNYSTPIIWPGYQNEDWRKLYMDNPHPCYDPKKDLLIPAFKAPSHFRHSPLMGAAPSERDILLFFRGDVGLHREKWYGRRIRQTLYQLSHGNGWRHKHQIFIGTSANYQGDYGVYLARSKFCLVAPGDGWSSRAEDSILHGCIPLVVMDGVHAVFEGALDWSKFSIRINQSDLPKTVDILSAISEERIVEMQRELTKVWHRFAYVTSPLHRQVMPGIFHHNQIGGGNRWNHSEHFFNPYKVYPRKDDAFHTIIQWLHGRMENMSSGR
eukprot:gene25771-11436_t